MNKNATSAYELEILRNQSDRNARYVALNNKLKSQSMGDVGKAILASLGIGMAARGALGLAQFTTGKLRKRKNVGTGTTIAEMPIPHMANEEKIAREDLQIKQPSWGLFTKERPTEPPQPMVEGNPRYQEWLKFKKPERGYYGFMMGDDATKPTGIPWYIPSLVLGGGMGLYGGYALTDKMLKGRQKAETEEELDEAKERYRKALLSQYSPEQVEKWSTADKITSALDELIDKVEASLPLVKSANNFLGTMTGAYGLLAGLLALGSGVATYKYTKSRSPEERLKKVLQQRQRERWLRRPPEIYAVPTSVPVVRPKYPEKEDIVDEELKDKAASIARGLFDA